MTWVIWRQYRVTAAIAGAILAAFAVLFLITGLQDAARWHAALASCARNATCGDLGQVVSLTTGPVDGPVYTLTILTLAVPLLFGMFWGSPAVARERETATVQFAWTQSVTRRTARNTPAVTASAGSDRPISVPAAMPSATANTAYPIGAMPWRSK